MDKIDQKERIMKSPDPTDDKGVVLNKSKQKRDNILFMILVVIVVCVATYALLNYVLWLYNLLNYLSDEYPFSQVV